MSERRKDTVLTAIVSTTLTALLILGVTALADQDSATDGVPRLIPYRGTLEQDGQPYDGGITMVFRIHDEADALVFEEAQEVQVFQGRFSVLLGSTGPDPLAALTAAVTDADQLFLSVALRRGDDAETLLSNRQRFLPVPYALWTTASTDLRVGNTLNVAGHTDSGTLGVSGQASVGSLGVLDDAVVGGGLSAGGDLRAAAALSSGGDVTVGDDLELGGRFINFRARDGVGDGGNLAFHGSDDILVLNNGGGFRDVRIEGDTLTLVAPTLRFRTAPGQYVEALSLRGDTLWLNRGGGIAQGTQVAGRLLIQGSLQLGGNEFMFSTREGHSGAGMIAFRGANDTLILNRNSSFAGGTQIDGDLHLNGSTLDLTSDDNHHGSALRAETRPALFGGELHTMTLNPDGEFDSVTVEGTLQATTMMVYSSKADMNVPLSMWFNLHCTLYFGIQNQCEAGCPGEGNNPSNWGWTNEEECGLAGDAVGSCFTAADSDNISHRWLGLSGEGDINANDRFFVSFKCVD